MNARAISTPALAATIAAAALVAQHVMGRATRDAMFLSHFPVTRLPEVMIVGAVVSGIVVVLLTKLIQRRGPARVVPVVFALHAVGLLVEWALSWRFESAVSVIVYVHTASVGATIVSAFWSAVTESFDPYTAKQVIGRISAGAALGGVIGGGLAWGASKITGVATMLLLMMALSLVCAWGTLSLSRNSDAARTPAPSSAPGGSTFGVLRDTPYLRLLALVVLVGAIMQSLLDYALGVQATAAYGTGARLLSFFALFQTAIAVVAFLVQSSTNRLALDRLGLGGTIALLPGGVVALGAIALGVPSLLTVALQRGAEGVLRASLFRSAYEVLFTPVPQALKRPTKTAIDVSFDRVGMVIGGALTLGLIAVVPQSILRAVTICAILAAMVQLFISYRLHRGYIATLAERLRTGALKLDPRSLLDATTRTTLSQTMEGLDRATLIAQIAALQAAKGAKPAPAPVAAPDAELPDVDMPALDDRVRLMSELRSPDAGTVRAALRSDASTLAPLAGELIELLARDDVARDAMRALAPIVPRIVGALVDAVLDDERLVRGRRRAARLLGGVSSPRAAHGLVLALDSTELDVRYACGRVLLGLREANADLAFDADAMLARARRELGAGGEARLDSRRLEHAFNVLSLTFDLAPMQLAYGALEAKDPALRGVALEYLDVVLPVDMRAALLQRLEVATSAPESVHAPVSRSPRPSTRSLDDLLKSRDTIRLSLDERRRLHDPDGEPSSR